MHILIHFLFNQYKESTLATIQDTEVVTAVVDINDVYNYRSAVISRSHQASAVEHYPRINVDLSLGGQCELPLTPYIEPRYSRQQCVINCLPQFVLFVLYFFTTFLTVIFFTFLTVILYIFQNIELIIRCI